MKSIIVLLLPVVVCISTLRAQSLVFPPYGHSYGIRKATPAHLFMFFGPSTTFDNPQGLATTRMLSRDDPATEADDDEVVVYGVNAGRHEIIYNTSMWNLDRYGGYGAGKGQFSHPRGIAAEPHGNVFVADSGNNRIVHLFNPHRKVEWVREYRGALKGDKGLSGPTQIALDEQCRMYVADTRNQRIVVLDTTGTLMKVIVPSGERFEDGPMALAVADGASRYSHFKTERVIFCADRGGRRLWKLSLDGAVLASITLPSTFRARYGAVDYYHSFWVTDFENNCVLKFSRTLELLDTFGSHGKGDNQFVQPRGIAIWKRYGQTFIAEQKGAQYYWIGTHCTNPRLVQSDSLSLSLSARFTEYSYVSLFRTAGSDTLYLLKRQFVPAGTVQRTIPLGSRDRAFISGGFTLKIEPTYSSYTYYDWKYPLSIQQAKGR